MQIKTQLRTVNNRKKFSEIELTTGTIENASLKLTVDVKIKT